MNGDMTDADCMCSPPPEFLVPPPPKPPLMPSECEEMNGMFHAEEICENYEPVSD